MRLGGGEIRRITDKIVDAAFFIKSPAGLKKTLVILHGASCSGKSYAMRRLKRKYKGFVFIEMDQFMPGRIVTDPNILESAFKLLTDTGISTAGAKALVRKIESAHVIKGKGPRHKSMVELLKICLAHDAVIATCANLPPPNLDNGYYEMLGRYTSKTVLHVLVAPESGLLAERIKKRGRDSQMNQWLESNRNRLANRAYYDLVLSGTETTFRILELIRNSISKKQDS